MRKNNVVWVKKNSKTTDTTLACLVVQAVAVGDFRSQSPGVSFWAISSVLIQVCRSTFRRSGAWSFVN